MLQLKSSLLRKRQSFASKAALFASFILVVFSSCKKDNGGTLPQPVRISKGFYILNEGIFQNNNSTLDYYDYKSGALTRDIFGAANAGKKLGDTGNDVEIYGSRLYIVMNGSNTLEVARASDAVSIGTLSFLNGGSPRQPRNIVFDKNHAFVSCFDGTVQVIDTASLQIVGQISVGRNPEKMGITANRLYVANSGGLSNPNYDSTVSVIDLGSLKETARLNVPFNPAGVAVDSYGTVYVISNGNYTSVPPSLSLINPAGNTISHPFTFQPSAIAFSGDSAYVFATDPKTSKPQYLLANIKTQSLTSSNFITDGTDGSITYPFALRIDKVTKNVVIGDARDFTSAGQVTIYDRNGKTLKKIQTGINPGHIAFYGN